MADLKINLSAGGGDAAATEIKKITTATGVLADASKKVASASKESGEALEDFGKRGSAAKDAFEGVSMAANGGAGAIFGFSKAWVNLKAAFAANPVTAILAVLLGTLGLVQKGFDLLGQAAERSRDKLFGTGEQTAALQASLAGVQQASATALAAMQEQVASLLTLYTSLNGELDRSVAAFSLIENARSGAEIAGLEVLRQQALDAPGADAAAINAEFDQRTAAVKAASALAITNRKTGAARLRQNNAEELVTGIETERIGLTRQVAAAEIAFESATTALAAATARAQIAAAEANLAKFDEQSAPRLAGARATIADSQAAIQAAGFEDTTRQLQGIATNRIQARARATASARAISGEIAPLLGAAQAQRAPFSEAGYFSEEARERDRARYAAGAAPFEASFAEAKLKASQIAARLGDARSDDIDARELIATLDRIIRATDQTSSGSLKEIQRRLGQLEAAVKNARN